MRSSRPRSTALLLVASAIAVGMAATAVAADRTVIGELWAQDG